MGVLRCCNYEIKAQSLDGLIFNFIVFFCLFFILPFCNYDTLVEIKKELHIHLHTHYTDTKWFSHLFNVKFSHACEIFLEEGVKAYEKHLKTFNTLK